MSPSNEKLAFAALVGPIGIIPAIVFLEFLLALLDAPMFPLISGYLIGNGDLSSAVKLAVLALVIVFYPTILFIGVPMALLLRHFHRQSIYGLVTSPLILALILDLITLDFETTVVLSFCATGVAVGCWGAYKVACKRL